MFDALAYRQRVETAAEAIRARTSLSPKIGLILGTGLSELASKIEAEAVIPYQDIPGFPLSTVESHPGRLLVGTLSGAPVYALQGRFHLYEGYDAQTVVFPVRAFGALGVDTLLVSNAAGGMNPVYRKGELMLLSDHINFQNANPLIGPNIDDWGDRFPDMSAPYDEELQKIAEEKALEEGIKLHRGVYVSVTGPNLETRAEYRMLRAWGADVVGMSTVPEVIAARHMNMRVLAVSVVTDECFPDALAPVSLEEIIAAAGKAEPHLTRLMSAIVSTIGA